MSHSQSDDAGLQAPSGGRTAGWSEALRTALFPLLGLFEDPRITEIEANGFDDVWVKGAPWPGHRRTNVRWSSQEDFRLACIRAAEVIGRQVSEASPLCNARLPGGERVNIAVPPACARIALTIRLFPAETLTFDKLEELGSVDGKVRTVLESLVLARKSILIAGGTGSGKTSLLNAMSQVIPRHERIVTIEDARELQIQQPNWVAMETVEPYQEGGTRVAIGDLVKNALRQTPDRIVVGEVRGEEAFYLLRALSTGHGGASDVAQPSCDGGACQPEVGSSSCSSSCTGGNDCPDRCSPVCAQGKLCCPWAGGACLPNDAGGCSGAQGYSCATPTAAGSCPNQCYP
jgi:Flp pilus assembly CpaF family ATPase